MTREEDLKVVRRAFAKQITAAASVTSPRIEDAFARVPREAFLGAGPWQVLRLPRGYVPTPDADPVYLYTNDLVAIIPDRQINNGQPSLHAHLMASANPADGEHAVHVGAGTGYYSAVLATLVGVSGRVTAVEYEPELAERARGNLAAYTNVQVIQGDGGQVPFDPADVIYVNAGATRPAASWLDGLKEGGRLILPLTTDEGFNAPRIDRTVAPNAFQRRGVVFRITRVGDDFHARRISAVAIFPAVGARDPESEKALVAALQRGDAHRVTRLYRDADLPAERRWLSVPGFTLAYS